MLLNKEQQVHLKCEFEKLGFDLNELGTNEILPVGKNGFYVTTMTDINDARMNADLFGALFTFKLKGDQPLIETIFAAFLNRLPNGNAEAASEKSYNITDGALPTKEKIFSDLNEMVRIKKIKEQFTANNTQVDNNKRLRPGM